MPLVVLVKLAEVAFELVNPVEAFEEKAKPVLFTLPHAS